MAWRHSGRSASVNDSSGFGMASPRRLDRVNVQRSIPARAGCSAVVATVDSAFLSRVPTQNAMQE